MDVFTIVLLVLALVVLLFASKFISTIIRLFFIALVAVFIGVLFFGVSFNEVLQWVTKMILWAL